MTARLLLPLFLAAAACAPSGRAEVEVFAAASLREAIEDVATLWRAHGGAPVRLSFAGSQILARQILAVDRAHVFLSADELEADRVIAAGRGEQATRRIVLSNRIALVVSAEAPAVAVAAAGGDPGEELDELLRGASRIALGDPAAVPVGRYARAWLELRGLWQEVAPRVVNATNARAALALVESGAAPLGIVYATDARAASGARAVHTVPPEEGPPIAYVGLTLSGAPPAARAFLEFLGEPPARAVLERHGFLVP